MATFDTLAVHKVNATFEGVQHIPCRGRTSLCPDRCGHAKDSAVFKTIEYEDFQKNGEHGDKTDVFHADMNPNARNNRQEDRFIEMIKGFQPGQKVRLHWDHIYVHNEGMHYPERLIRELEAI